ncbi:MAG: tetratricopeptide repeat protein, partial [Tepidisphaeraceae bacterium]
LRSDAGLRAIWLLPRATPQYYPLVFTTFWFEYRLWRDLAAGYHAVNLLLHATSAVILWGLLRRLRVPGAWVAAAVFAVHPVNVESVAWITERKNVLSLVFSLLAAHVFLFDFARIEDRIATGRTRAGIDWSAYGWALVFFACALLSKTVACTLPAALLVVLWWKLGRITRRDVLCLLPMFIAGAAMGLFTAHLERTFVGADGPEWNLSLADRCLIAGRGVWFYAWKLLCPVNLVFIYPRWNIDSHELWQYAFPTSATALIVAAWLLRGRIGRGPLAALLLFGGTLVPALGFVNVFPMRYSFVADHFQYAATIAPIALIAAGATLATRRANLPAAASQAVGVIVVCVLGCVAFAQCRTYADVETLWKRTIARNPRAWMAYNNLGASYFNSGDKAQAAKLFNKSLEMYSRNDVALHNLGLILWSENKEAEAVNHFRRAVEVEPRCGPAHYGLGLAHKRHGEIDQAMDEFRLAIKYSPTHIQSYSNLAI